VEGFPLDFSLHFLYNTVTVLNKTKMTVTTNERGQQNMFAKEPQMYISQTDAERYALESHAERAERLNGRTAMLGFVAAIISYALTGHLFFGVI
jgi:predicted ATPase